MDRWSATLKVPIPAKGTARCRVAVSLRLSPSSETLIAPSANAVFFNGDRVVGTGNPVVERLSDLQAIADVLVSKFGGSVNAWVVEASTFNGPFAVYKEFVPSVNKYGEPRLYSHVGFPASSSIVSLLSNCLEEAKSVLSRRSNPVSTSLLPPQGLEPKTIILGFSKGGTVLNQLVTELSHSQTASSGHPSFAEQELLDSPNGLCKELTHCDSSSMALLGNGATVIASGFAAKRIDCCSCSNLNLRRLEAK
ncbi:hypothetical protein BT93_D1253 [Corymbia citriodora subsp. variegata]|nr:hypothetical protein BT93_D1253 [Corymbia citriodora subsp. variegata]